MRLLAACVALHAAAASAQQANAPPPPVTDGEAAPAVTPAAVITPSGPTPAEQVRSVIERHCESCHGASAKAPAPPIIAVDADVLSRRRALVQPGLPDASRLYTIMLSGHLASGNAPATAPSPEDVDRVRAWISSVPPSPACRLQRPVTLPQLARMLQRLREPGAEALKTIRFISLAGYHNSCAAPRAIEETKAAVHHVLSKLRTNKTTAFELPYAADDLPVLAVRLTDLGWHAARWDALAAQADAPALVDQALADAYDTTTPIIDAAALASAVDDLAAMYILPSAPSIDTSSGLAAGAVASAASDLIYDGRSDVTVQTAAADVGIQPAELLAMLAAMSETSDGHAQALLQGPIPRSSWNALRADLVLPGKSDVLRYTVGVQARVRPEIPEVHLWTNQTSYQRGALLVMTVQPNFDCNLTVVNVDPSGDATVLYPSDSDPDNAVKAGTKVRIPSDAEPYQLRTAEVGTETFIAVCSANRKRMLGVTQDFERQRFSILGNWSEYLKTAATREQEIAKREPPRQRRRRSRAAAPPPVPPPVDQGPEREARSAIYVKVE